MYIYICIYIYVYIHICIYVQYYIQPILYRYPQPITYVYIYTLYMPRLEVPWSVFPISTRNLLSLLINIYEWLVRCPRTEYIMKNTK